MAEILIPISKKVPEGYSATQITICTILLVVCWVTVILRFWTRTVIVRVLGMDDYFALASAVCFTCYCILLSVENEMVTNRSVVTEDTMTIATNIIWALEVFYVVTVALLRISLGYFFLRIIHQPWQRRLIYGIMIFYSTFSFGYFWYAIFQCGVPTKEHFWQAKTLAKCGPKARGLGLGYFHSAITAGADLIYVVLPLPLVLTSSLNRREKIGVIAILLVATLGCVASLVRIKWVPVLVDVSTDIFYNGFWLAIWSAIEPGLGIITSSVACLRPMMKEVIASIYTASTRGTRTQNKPSEMSKSTNSKGLLPSHSTPTPNNNNTTTFQSKWKPFFLTQNSNKSQARTLFNKTQNDKSMTATHHIYPPRHQYRPSMSTNSQVRSPIETQRMSMAESVEESDAARWLRRQRRMNQRYNPKRHSGLPLHIFESTGHDRDDESSLFG